MKEYTHAELMKMTGAELRKLKESKITELTAVQNGKLIIIGNILSLQGMIKKETNRI